MGAEDLNRVVELTLAFISSNLFFSSAFSLRSLTASRFLTPEEIQRMRTLDKTEQTAAARRFSHLSTPFAEP